MGNFTNQKVLLAMSGGLDSSVAAMLLKEKGFTITGITFRPFDSLSTACLEKETGCCNADTLFEAKKLAETLQFEHHIIDIRREFREVVINNFIEEYLKGRTPNPCILCNKFVKWGILLKEADRLGCHYIATGHYARIGVENNRYFLKKAIDQSKDQSYFLWTLSNELLSRTLFPLGELTKNEVREIARTKGFVKIAAKRESQEICFIHDNDYRKFLTENTLHLPGKGFYKDINGLVLGEHKGYPFYTIGQRKGLNIAFGQPAYVISIDAATNTVVLGDRESLLSKSTSIENTFFNKYECYDEIITVKIRYKTPPLKAIIRKSASNDIIEFIEDAYAVTPGQSVVFYKNDDVLGGAIISNFH